MEYYFLSRTFKEEIDENVLGKMFPVLNTKDRNFLLERLYKIIDTIAMKFNFNIDNEDNKYIYEYQFRQNNYRDLKGIVLLLLPFIDEIYSSMTKIRSLNDIYITKKKGG